VQTYRTTGTERRPELVVRPLCEVVLLVLVVLVHVVLVAGLSVTVAEVALLRRHPAAELT